VKGEVHLPFSNVPMDILSMNLTIDYVDVTTKKTMARIPGLVNQKCHYHPFSGQHLGTAAGELTIDLMPQYVQVLDEDLFSSFLADAMLTKGAKVLMRTQASQLISVPVGNLTITGIQMEQIVDVPGLDHFSSPPISVVRQEVVGSTPDSLIIDVTMNLTNPSVVSGIFSPINLDMHFEGQRIGYAKLPGFNLRSGSNILETVSYF